MKRLYQWLPWAFALGLALVFLAFMRNDLHLQERAWNERLAGKVQLQKDQLASRSRDLTQQALVYAQQLLLDDSVRDEILRAHQLFITPGVTSQQTAAARAVLATRLEESWYGMKAAGVHQLSVYFGPGAVAFLRMHDRERAGDSLIGVRPLIAQAIATGAPVRGLDISRQSSGYRGILPIKGAEPGEGVIGVIEVAISSLWSGAGDGLAAARPFDMAIFLCKTAVSQVLWEQARQKLHRQNPTVVDDWRLEETSDLQLREWWKRGAVAINQQGQLIQEEDATFLLSWLPQIQPGVPEQESPLAVAVWNDISEARDHYQSIRHWVIAKWMGALVCAQLLLLLFVRFNRSYIRHLVARHGEQLRAEHAQSEQSRQRLALALRSSDSGFWEWDIVQDKATFSPEWRQWCGLGPEPSGVADLDEWMSRIHPADKRLSYADIVRHLKGEIPMYENEYRVKIADGSYKWILTRGRVVEWQEDGRAALMVGVYSDITARKNMELISVRLQAALHALSEIASLPAIDTAEQLRLALSLGARYLGLGNGLITEIVGDECRSNVRFTQENYPIALTVPLSKTYCSLAVASGDVFAEDNIANSEHREHPAYLHSQIETYIGAPLWVGGELYGALGFFSLHTRNHQYDSLDKDFVRLLARWVGSVVERWQQEREKKIILQRFQKLNERLPGFLYQFQLRPDGRAFFPYASPGIKTIYNVMPEDAQVSAEKVFAAIHPDDAAWVADSIVQSATRLSPWIADMRINNPRRGIIWAHAESHPEKLDDGSVLWHGYVSDITSIKLAQQRMQETNALHQAILDAASVSIISMDTAGIIKTLNRGAELMFGYSAAEMIDRQSPLVLHDPRELADYAERLSCELGCVIESGHEALIAKVQRGGIDEREWTFIRKDGTRMEVILTVSALRSGEGEITGYLGVARDISEIKRIDKMKNEFLSIVSHELRTPLTAISGALGIVANGLAGQLPYDAARMIQIAHRNSQRLILLVNDLLDMDKLVAGQVHFDLQTQSLLPLIQQSMEFNGAFAAQYGVTYRLAPEAVDVKVRVDGQRLLQVMANYLSNAAKFSPLNDEVVIAVNLRPGAVRVTVTDKGPGIPAEFRERLFMKFSQADSSDSRQKTGTGLGLAICKEIIERMGGKVGVESIPGQGASFYFDLPCSTVAPAADATAAGGAS